MSLQDELTATQRRLDDLDRCLTTLEQHVGSSVDMRRVRADANHLREDLALLRESAPRGGAESTGQSKEAQRMITVPDAPYDPNLWKDAEDEGLGVRDHHAP
ncbi:hypothetical protein [Streptantibioticus ferralitis]|uniref:Uncharacterized protein n=1 Tax=Streptantibioticus ferralitis TaxID=236510 RepID=A0ABT5ZB50_9ACTN|nr:hypothetical protein [Streptantibioticus ferralitis]MDF2261071.1 hypothetical protein [Streptantibioticus ferralitis]